MDTTMRRGPGIKVGEPTDSAQSASAPLRGRFAYPLPLFWLYFAISEAEPTFPIFFPLYIK